MELCSKLGAIQEGLGENGYMYLYGWVPSLFTGSYHNIVYWLYPIQRVFGVKKKLKKKKRRSFEMRCFFGEHLKPFGRNLDCFKEKQEQQDVPKLIPSLFQLSKSFSFVSIALFS